ncbi:MAG: D-2-hydroxyacid dehydrogenase [Chloroflexi bacterium]|nr:D-2-hydroxyacid dehydrogenase [Chloroflexota bacterium]
MALKVLIYPRGGPNDDIIENGWPALLKRRIPGIDVRLVHSRGEAMEAIEDVDAAFGDIDAEIFAHAKNVKWIACPQAGPPAGWYHKDMIESDVVVTNVRGIYNDVISAHIMSFILAFARGLHVYMQLQAKREWSRPYESVHLPGKTVGIVGVGGIGGETARLCSEFGMTVLGVDARLPQAPKGVSELHRPDALNRVLPRCDFVAVTVPETPQTQGMFNLQRFKQMKNSAFFINIGRGATTILDDLVTALRTGEIRGAALDVFQVEPLPSSHPLWTMPNVIITPHIAAHGPERELDDRRTELFIENCVRFNEGKELNNVVDKANWF